MLARRLPALLIILIILIIPIMAACRPGAARPPEPPADARGHATPEDASPSSDPSAVVDDFDDQIARLERLIANIDASDPDMAGFMMELVRVYFAKRDYLVGVVASLDARVAEARATGDEEAAARYEAERNRWRRSADTGRLRGHRLLTILVHDPKYAAFVDLDDALVSYARIALREGDVDTAHAVYQRLLNDFPNSPHHAEAYVVFADYYLDHAELDHVAGLYTRAIDATGPRREARSEEAAEIRRLARRGLVELAQTYAKLEDWDASTKVYELLRDRFADDPDACAWQRSIVDNLRMTGDTQQLDAEQSAYSRSCQR